MKLQKKVREGLDKRFQKIEQTPASFALYIAIHDFIEFIELNTSLSSGLSERLRINRELDIPAKYTFLKHIYQGLEDIDRKSDNDIGHDRYSAIRELTSIKNNDVSESNSLWKKREVYRRMTGIVYRRLSEPEEVVSA